MVLNNRSRVPKFAITAKNLRENTQERRTADKIGLTLSMNSIRIKYSVFRGRHRVQWILLQVEGKTTPENAFKHKN